MKAKFSGTCQVCGSGQKLPDGFLSKHGYTVEWNMFNGVCWGAGHKPFEQDISLIEKAIRDAESEAQHLTKLAETTEKRRDICWVHHYVAGTWERGHRQGGYQWIQKQPDEIKCECGQIYYEHEGKRHQNGYGTIEKANSARADDFRHQAAQYRRYAAWQRQRIEGWEPKPLTPVEPDKPKGFGRCHGRDRYAIKCGKKAIDASGRCEHHPQGWDN